MLKRNIENGTLGVKNNVRVRQIHVHRNLLLQHQVRMTSLWEAIQFHCEAILLNISM